VHQAALEQIERAPQSTGVYLFKDEKKNILYVGKALRLRDRLKSYVKLNRDERPSIALLVPQIQEVEWLLTDNEKEALLLENSLIKSHRPKYNIELRDDKSYVSLRLTPHKFPRLFITRKIIKDGSVYFGPYSSVRDLRQTLKLLQRIFLLRDCSDSYFKNRSRPCLRYQIKRCSAPCVDYVDEAAYGAQVLQARQFLSGNKKDLIQSLHQSMVNASESQEYEKAAVLRDRFVAIQSTLEPQKVESRKDEQDADAVGIAGDGDATLLKVLKIRKGRLVGADEFLVQEPVSASEEIFRAFLQEYYLQGFPGREIPPQLLLPALMADAKSFEVLLSDQSQRRVRLHVPKRGKSFRLLKLAERNARSSLGERKRKSEHTTMLLNEVARKFKLRRFPKRIEGYDISTFHGAQPVGAMIVFMDGEADSTKYRHFNIRTVKGSNDFAMLKEMFERRFRKLDDTNRPDLVLVDGGKGQLRQAMDVLQKLQIEGFNVIAIAKEKELRTRSGKRLAPERFYVPGQKNAIVLPKSSKILHLLQRVRDEAHRFCITRHRKARKSSTLQSVLGQIPGIGPKRQKVLLKAFRSLDHIARATLDELKSTKGMTESCAAEVFNHFRSQKNASEE